MQSLKLVFYFLFFMLAGLGSSVNMSAQQPSFITPFAPEQFPCGAITICADSYVTNNSYFYTEGNWTSIRYEHWLKVEIANSGKLLFMITPHFATDNYDFTVYKGANGNCAQVQNTPVLRRNAAPANPDYNQGRTGLYMNATLEITNMSQYCRPVDALAGETYYIKLENYGPIDSTIPPVPFPPFHFYLPTYGYAIDFTASTCGFVTGAPSRLDSVAFKCSNYKELNVHLTRPIKASSIAIDASDFELSPSPGSLYMAKPLTTSDPLTMGVKIELAPHLPPGTYTLRAKQGTDGNTFIDMCDVELPIPDVIQFVVPDLDSTVNLKVCPQQMPYTWNGINIPAPGNNLATFTSPNVIGCDSFTTLNLTVVDTMRDTVNLLVCPFELPYTWHGITVTAPGMNVATFHTAASGGCDSAVTLNLKLLLPLSQTLQLSSCGPLVFNGHTYSTSQVVLDTVKGYMGCDSLHRTLNITIHPAITPVFVTKDTAGCGSLLYEGTVYVSNTQLKDTLYNQFGCDSVYLTTNISVFPGTQPAKATITVADCNQVIFEGKTYLKDTTLVSVLKSRAGCDSVERTVKIVIEELGLVLTSDPKEPVKGDYVSLTVSANVPFQVQHWLPEIMFVNQTATGQNFIIRENGTYKVIAVSDLGCVDTAELKLRADSLIPVALMPNAFSPNGDGLNDEFQPFFVSKSGYVVRRFFIYNKWGQEVYHGYNLKTAAWNGLYGNIGKPADPGTYFYVIDIEFLDKTKTTFKGEVTLIH